jgi:hypothetical protein
MKNPKTRRKPQPKSQKLLVDLAMFLVANANPMPVELLDLAELWEMQHLAKATKLK